MPKLEYFSLAAELQVAAVVFRVTCNGPGRGEDEAYGLERVESRTLEFAVEGDGAWSPELETMRLLRRLGREKFEGEGVEKWVGERIGMKVEEESD